MHNMVTVHILFQFSVFYEIVLLKKSDGMGSSIPVTPFREEVVEDELFKNTHKSLKQAPALTFILMLISV